MTNEERCTRDDLEIIIDTPVRYAVNDVGEPSWRINDCEPLDSREYQCVACDEFFDTWQRALEHLDVSAERAA